MCEIRSGLEGHRTAYITRTYVTVICPATSGEYPVPESMGHPEDLYGAVWDGMRVRVEPLTPIFDLSTHWRGTKARHAIPSSLDPLMDGVRNIQSHHDEIEAEAKANPLSSEAYDRGLQKARGGPPPAGYPHLLVASYVDDGREITFTYEDAQLDPHETRLLCHPRPTYF
jgi:hypothetical protein